MTPNPAPDTDRGGIAQTLRRLFSAQKSAKGAPAYSRFVNRRLGRLIAAVAFHAGLTPNGVTAISAAWTFTGIAVLALVEPSLAMGSVVSICLVVGYAFDAADGQLARLQGGGSPAGEWLDHIVDCVKISSLHLALLIGMYRFELVERGPLLLLPLGFSVVAATHFFAAILNDQLRRRHEIGSASTSPAASASVLRALVVAPTDYGLLCLVFVLLGMPSVFVVVYALLLAANLGYLVLAAPKWYGQMRGLETEPRGAAASNTTSSGQQKAGQQGAGTQ